MVKKNLSLKKEKLSEIIKNELIESIINGEFKDKKFLPSEGELSEIYNVSKATIREAIGSLVDLGFIKRLHGIGLKIIDNSIQVASNSLNNMIQRKKASITEILEVRKIIEIQTAKLAAIRADIRDMDNLEETVEVPLWKYGKEYRTIQ